MSSSRSFLHVVLAKHRRLLILSFQAKQVHSSNLFALSLEFIILRKLAFIVAIVLKRFIVHQLLFKFSC